LKQDITPKRCKVVINKGDIYYNKNNNKFCSSTITENFPNYKQSSNVNYSKSNSKNLHVNDNCSSTKFVTHVELNQNQNKFSTETRIVELSNNNLSSSPSTSQEPHKIRKVIKPLLVIKEKVSIPEPEIDVFAKFMKICVEKRSDNVTVKILDKLQKRYNKTKPIFERNSEFNLFISRMIDNVLNIDQKKFYFYIQEVNNEIKRLSYESKIVQYNENNSNVSNDQIDDTGTNEEMILEQENNITLSKYDLYKLKKLDKTIKKCQQKITELETQEVNFDEEEDSIYLQEDRYKRKLIELCTLRSKIIGDKSMKKEIYKKPLRIKDIPDKLTNIKIIDEAIITFVNNDIKKMNKLKHIKNPTAIADFLTIPDYNDIIQCISDCNNTEDLELSEKKIKMLGKYF
jgi:hypothetical protein